MTSAKERFEAFKANFAKTDWWRAMQLEREGTPWHREENVAVHTNMLLRFYDENFAANRNNIQQLMTRVACLFHDVGKPPSRIVRRSPERGEYRAYHGHELVSARMWIDYATGIGKKDVEQILCFTPEQVSFVAFMIEHHVPFALAKVEKRKALKAGMYNRMGEEGHRAWLDLLLSDQHGRISDDQHMKLKAVDDWMYHWERLEFTDGRPGDMMNAS